jgi:hypothetical protein
MPLPVPVVRVLPDPPPATPAQYYFASIVQLATLEWRQAWAAKYPARGAICDMMTRASDVVEHTQGFLPEAGLLACVGKVPAITADIAAAVAAYDATKELAWLFFMCDTPPRGQDEAYLFIVSTIV